MKNIVVNDEYREADLKPSALLQEYISLLGQDVGKMLPKGRLISQCPACGCPKTAEVFEKFSFPYYECDQCQTLFVSARPDDSQIAQFYRNAPSKIFWRNQLSEASRSQRRAKIIKPRFEWITDSVAEYLPGARHWVDLHTGQQRYLQAMASVAIPHKTSVFPYGTAEAMEGINIVDKPWWETSLEADVVSVFELADHTQDVQGLFSAIHRMLNKGGLCFMTNILASGFDIKELGAHARNIYPPDRLNVFSVQGLKMLIEDNGFECLEFSTPGILDVEIVTAVLKEDPAIAVSPFVRDLILKSAPEVRLNFQEFLQTNLLSSYGRILMRKK